MAERAAAAIVWPWMDGARGCGFRPMRTSLSMPKIARSQAEQSCRHSSRVAVLLTLKTILLERLRSTLK